MAQLQFRSDDTITWAEKMGDGSNGSSYAVPANEGCSGTSGTKTLTLATAGGFTNNDLILIHQTRGTGAGNWQLNKILSGAGTTTLTLKYNLTNTYVDSGASQAQVIELNQYKDLTTGAITVPTWDGSKGGIVAFLDKGTCTIDNTINGVDKGFIYGATTSSNNLYGYEGEGTSGASDTRTDSPNGNGGGGGWGGSAENIASCGGGGGNGTAGTAGTPHLDYPAGQGGATGGATNLTTMIFGGGGGAGGKASSGDNGGRGGLGACIIVIFSKKLIITGAITLTGGQGVGGGASGGAGAGGSCLLKCETATLGSNLITASGGSPVQDVYSRYGGTGGVGRIHLDYSGSYTGSTNPAIDVRLDSTIKAGSSGNFFLVF